MSMKQSGLVKLSEEAAEVVQVAQKLVQYPQLQSERVLTHPDGTILLDRLEDEMGDVLAACYFVAKKLKLDQQKIIRRREDKLNLFERWDKEEEEDRKEKGHE